MPTILPDCPAFRTVAEKISRATRILAITHENPDGDALGSLAGMGHIAVHLGMETRLYCETPVPEYLAWLPVPGPVLSSLADLGAWEPDRIVFLDCGSMERAGEAILPYVAERRTRPGVEVLCIDHHLGNPGFGDGNWVDPAMSATGLMVAYLAKHFGLPLAGDLGEAVCLALVSDTGSFSYTNTTAETLEVTAEIVRNGLSMAEFTAKHENNWSISRMHLWGDLMRETTFACEGSVAVSVITDELLLRHNAPKEYLEGYASWMRRLKNTKVILMIRPATKGSKASLRSMGDVDVRAIAAEFGGGGHKAAAGVTLTCPPHEAARKMLQVICRHLGSACC